MSIQSEIERLQTAKENLKTAITGKGVTVSEDAKLDEYYTFVNGIQQGVEGGIDVSATTATEADVLSTAKFYKADGSFVSGTIQTVTPTLSGNVFSVEKGYVSEDKELTVPEMPEPSRVGNIITLYPGFLPNQTNIEIPTGTATRNGNTVSISEGWHYDDVIDVGAAYPGGTITPGTEDQIINADSYITSTLTIKGDSNLKAENIASGISIFGVSGTHSGGYNTSDATAIAGFVMEGYTFYGMSGKETGTLKPISTSDMVIMENAVLGIPATRYVDNGIYSLLNIAGIGDLAPENIVEGKNIAGIPGTHKCATTEITAGVLVEDNGVLKVQKLTFDGTVASDGDIVEADKFYLFETGHDEPDYGSGGSSGGGSSGGGSIEFYKCSAVHEATAGDGYVITGAGDAVLNGTYAISEQSDTEVEYENENGAILLHLIGNGWMLFDNEWSQRWDTNNVDYDSAADVPSWNCYVGEYPAPTVTATEGSPASWDGYKYDLDTKTFSETLTEGLEYKMASPIVGKVYNADTTMEIEYVPLAGIPNENIILNYPMTDLKLNTNNGFLFTDGGVPELITDGVARLRISYDGGKLETQKTLLQGLSEFTVSLWVKFYTMPSGEHAWIFYESGYSDYSRVLIDVNRDSNNHVGFYVRDTTTGDTGTWRSVYSNTVIQANKFYHIAVVYSAEEQSLYINGALEYKGTGGASLTDSASPSKGGITIGPDKPSAEDITHLRVFSKALNVDQVTILYNELSRLVTE